MANSFTPQQIEEFLQEFFDVVGARQYVGARYVPIFGRAGEETIEWDDRAPYEPLTVVMHEGVSYVSRRYVPTGIQVTDTDYWAQTYRFDAQVEQYRQEVLSFDGRISDNTAAIEAEHDAMLGAVDALARSVADDYVPFPDEDTWPKYGTSGQVLSTLADGTTKWVDPVVPSDEQAEAVITSWLDDHPEATTTVQDGSITWAKLSTAVRGILASEYSTSRAYDAGDYAVYDGVLYRFIMSRPAGAWDGGYCRQVDIADEMDRIYEAVVAEMRGLAKNAGETLAYVPYTLSAGVYDTNLALNTGIGGQHIIAPVRENTAYVVAGQRWAKSYPVAIFMHDDTMLGFTDENVALQTRFTDVRIVTPPGCNRVYVNGLSNSWDSAAPLIQEVVSDVRLANRSSVPVAFDAFTIPGGTYDSSYNYNSGAGARAEIAVSEGDVYEVNAYKLANSYPIVLFKASNAFVGYSMGKQPTASYRALVRIPAGVDTMVVQSDSRYNVDVQRLAPAVQRNSWAGRHVLWLGTSISAGGQSFRGAYHTMPEYVCSLLGATVHNEAVGESMLRRGYDELMDTDDPYGWTGAIWNNVFRSLMSTLGEKQELIDNYDAKWRDLLTGDNKPASMTDALATDIRGWSFENKVTPYLNGSRTMPDLVVIEHGRNDVPTFGTISREMPGAASVNPEQISGFNRSKYGDAMAYLIRLIRQYNRNVPIVILGHFDNTGTFALLPREQRDAATYNGVYFCDTTPMGWNGHLVTVSGYWSSGVWIPDNVTRTMTRLQQCLADAVHPFSDRSGNALMAESGLVYEYIQNHVRCK